MKFKQLFSFWLSFRNLHVHSSTAWAHSPVVYQPARLFFDNLTFSWSSKGYLHTVQRCQAICGGCAWCAAIAATRKVIRRSVCLYLAFLGAVCRKVRHICLWNLWVFNVHVVLCYLVSRQCDSMKQKRFKKLRHAGGLK